MTNFPIYDNHAPQVPADWRTEYNRAAEEIARLREQTVPLSHIEQALENAFDITCASNLWSERDKDTARRVICFVRAQLASDGVKPLE